MVHVERSIHVAAPRETVFAFMDDAHHQAEISPSLSEVHDVTRAESGGVKAGFTYKMAGMPIKGEVEATRYTPPERIEFDMRGPLDGRIWFVFENAEGGTTVTYGSDYSIPNTLVERLAKPFLERYNARELETTLQNLKERVEFAGAGGEAGTAAP